MRAQQPTPNWHYRQHTDGRQRVDNVLRHLIRVVHAQQSSASSTHFSCQFIDTVHTAVCVAVESTIARTSPGSSLRSNFAKSIDAAAPVMIEVATSRPPVGVRLVATVRSTPESASST